MSSKRSSTHNHKKAPNPMTSTSPIVDNLTPSQLEALLLHTLSETNHLSDSDHFSSREVAMAKMVNYCIRMLHSHGWVPRTVVRAMVLMEADPESERSVKGFMYMGMRQRRDELRARRVSEESAVDSGFDGDGRDGSVAEAGVSAADKAQGESVVQIRED